MDSLEEEETKFRKKKNQSWRGYKPEEQRKKKHVER